MAETVIIRYLTFLAKTGNLLIDTTNHMKSAVSAVEQDTQINGAHTAL